MKASANKPIEKASLFLLTPYRWKLFNASSLLEAYNDGSHLLCEAKRNIGWQLLAPAIAIFFFNHSYLLRDAFHKENQKQNNLTLGISCATIPPF